MDYEYDFFISYPYKKDGDEYGMIEDWVDSCFVPRLNSWARMELGREVEITDGRHAIGGGDWWPQRLQQILARSRILVPIFCPLYFNSTWCQKELFVFLRRAEAFGLREDGKCGLVLPIHIHGKVADLPAAVGRIQLLDCRNFFMSSEELLRPSDLLTDFGKSFKEWAPEIAQAIRNTPTWQSSWLDEPLPEVELQGGSALPQTFASEDIPSSSKLIRRHDYKSALAGMDRFIDAGELEPARQFGQRFLTKDGYPLAALIFDHALNRIGQTDPSFSRMLANRAYSLIGLERFHEAVGCLKQVRELRAADGAFRSWHAVALAYAYFRLGKNRKCSDWLAYARRRAEEYTMRIKKFAELYPEIADALVAS